MTKFLNISTDNTLGGNSPSDSTVVSQKATKEYVDSGISAKLDKSSTATVVYGTNSSGNQTTYSIASSATAATVAFRGTGGVLKVGTPTANTHAATKKYVDDGVAAKQDTLVSGTNIKTINNQSILGSGNIDTSESGGGYHPNILSWEWDDHLRNSVQWLRGDTFSWQSGSVYQVAYQHLVDDISGKTLQTETVNGTTISFYLADDGHKICPSTQEQNVLNVFNSTGVAWYYVLDTTNQRFKLPRDNSQSQRVLIKTITSGTKWARVYSDGWVEQGGTDGTSNTTINLPVTMADTNYVVTCGFAISNNGAQIVTKYTDRFVTGFDTNYSWTSGGWLVVGYADTTYLANVTSQFDAQYKYLYFYVGEFTQSALENTAGVTTETLNTKVDKGHQVVAFQAPTAQNNYTWYRKYADGWVEQGGEISYGTTAITFPVTMASSNYTVNLTQVDGSIAGTVWLSATRATGGLTVYYDRYNKNTTSISWQVSGMAA